MVEDVKTETMQGEVDVKRLVQKETMVVLKSCIVIRTKTSLGKSEK